MDEKELRKIANLAKLNIGESEISSMLNDFSSIVQYVDEIKNLDTSIISDDDIYKKSEFKLRLDEARNDLKREDLAKIAPSYENGYVVVPKVIET
ncbi:Asp-tRNA(Asn)/Glu-tRNA(Gln) amidotransferase subunit GatC [Leptospira sp. 96542]|nr:Asp-tRNA(Asn)/Glu-tRNA(Gln) amidotransferase subunit GatC [Leptospira sp. 96542]